MTDEKFEKWLDEVIMTDAVEYEKLVKEVGGIWNDHHHGFERGAKATYEMMQGELKLLTDVVGISDEEAVILNLKAQLAQAREQLEKISVNPYIQYGHGKTETVTDRTHQYMMGVTDGHRLAKQWADKALAAIDIKPVAVVEAGCYYCGDSWIVDQDYEDHTHKGILIVLPEENG